MKPRKYAKQPILSISFPLILIAVLTCAILIPVFFNMQLGYDFDRTFVYPNGTAILGFTFNWPDSLRFVLMSSRINVAVCIAGLIAFHLSPYRHHWSLLLVWTVFSVLCAGPFSDAVQLGLAYSGLWLYLNSNFIPTYYAVDAIGLLLALGLLFAMTRSRLIVICWGVAMVVLVFQGYHYATQNQSLIWPIHIGNTYYFFHAGTYVFHLFTTIPLLTWAILERRKPIPEIPCPTCDYDLTGLSLSAPCPECGEIPPEKPSPSGAVAHAEGVNHDPSSPYH